MKKIYFYTILLFTSLSFSQIINFPDANFKAKLLQADVTNTIASDYNGNPLKIDTNNNNEIEVSEALTVFSLNVSNSTISDLTGIESFTNLVYISCSYNNLTSLDVNALNLDSISTSHNIISSCQINWTYLHEIDLSYNQLTSFTIGASTNNYHSDVNLSHNNLTNLLFENSVVNINVSYNNLSSIQANGNIFLGGTDGSHQLNFSNNNFSLLDFETPNINLFGTLIIGNNTIDKVRFKENAQPVNITYTSNNTSLDLGNFKATTNCDPEYEGHLTISNSPNLQSVILKNGFNHTQITCTESNVFQIPALDLQISNCPNLNYICVDEAEQPFIQARINQLGLQNQIQLNTYCTFTLGGTYYTINGNTKFDVDSNGCNVTDTSIPSQKFTITNGSETSTIIANNVGDYSIPVGSGTQTITPVIDNPSNFSVTPPNVVVNFPTQASPFTQNFCVAPAAFLQQFDITIVPITPAIPGFNATYRIIYKNTGNSIESGNVELNFNDAVLDFVSTNYTYQSISTGHIRWDVSNLYPFETRTIDVVLNLNTPMETPALNAGDILNFDAFIANNLIPFTTVADTILQQTVVNSMDPNDKTCLSGSDINPSEIGKYVKYLIRFENTGTFPAQNIVVKDMIDSTKFDVSNLTPIGGSHLYTTKVTGNKVEFIFENINLPFDNANNDGFVVFKIKSLPTLQVNDVITNQASIYFDYNFPINTNTASSTYRILANESFENSNVFKIYPVPSSDVLNISSNNQFEIKAIEIYNQLGQIVQKELGNKNQINVSQLQSGTYFLKIKTENSVYTQQFIKD